MPNDTPLHKACHNGELPQVKAIIEGGELSVDEREYAMPVPLPPHPLWDHLPRSSCVSLSCSSTLPFSTAQHVDLAPSRFEGWTLICCTAGGGSTTLTS